VTSSAEGERRSQKLHISPKSRRGGRKSVFSSHWKERKEEGQDRPWIFSVSQPWKGGERRERSPLPIIFPPKGKGKKKEKKTLLFSLFLRGGKRTGKAGRNFLPPRKKREGCRQSRDHAKKGKKEGKKLPVPLPSKKKKGKGRKKRESFLFLWKEKGGDPALAYLLSFPAGPASAPSLLPPLFGQGKKRGGNGEGRVFAAYFCAPKKKEGKGRNQALQAAIEKSSVLSLPLGGKGKGRQRTRNEEFFWFPIKGKRGRVPRIAQASAVPSFSHRKGKGRKKKGRGRRSATKVRVRQGGKGRKIFALGIMPYSPSIDHKRKEEKKKKKGGEGGGPKITSVPSISPSKKKEEGEG